MKCNEFIRHARTRIVVEKKDVSDDELGGRTSVWVAYKTYWAWLKPVSTYEKMRNEQLQSSVTHKAIIRFDSGLRNIKESGDFRVSFDSRVFAISGIKNFDGNLKYYGTKFQQLDLEDNAVETD